MKRLLWLVLLASGMTWSCTTDPAEPIPDVSGIDVEVEVRRFEQELFGLDTTQWANELADLEARYPAFSTLYFERILRSKMLGDEHPTYVKGFIQHPSVRQLYDTCMIVFEDFEPIAREFEDAFRFYKYYFPEDTLSGTLTTFISEYTIGVFLYEDNKIGLGLDFFLGADYPYQTLNPSNPNFSNYLTRSFTPKHMVEKAFRLLLEDKLGYPQGNRLLDMMVHNGKKLYLLDKMLPNTADSILMEVTAPQMDWLEESERDIWSFFINENLLYSTDFQDIRKYIEYSPNSPGMPAEAPGRTGNWLGWQIVKAYMKRQPEATLQDLIMITDAQQILDASRYKPGR
jgi:hypothetical protein